MTDDELERLLTESFQARADAAVHDDAAPPAPRFAQDAADNADAPVVRPASTHRSAHRAGRARRPGWLAPVAAAAAVVAVAGAVLAIADAQDEHGKPGVQHAASRPNGVPSTTGGSGASSAQPNASQSASTVHVKLLNGDGDRYGVGMPVIAFFSKNITDGRPLQSATTVTVDGKRKQAAWYFERSEAGNGPLEGHLRLEEFWPAHAKVHVSLPVKGKPAGGGLTYDNSLTLDFTTGARNIATVDDRTHLLTVTSDGSQPLTYPVSLGAASTPTLRGTKVIMDKGGNVCMDVHGKRTCNVKDTQRLTYSGEYLHAAPWNAANIDDGVDSSNGCTNLQPADAKDLYDLLKIGDVVRYEHTDGPVMKLGQGYGDWNVDWGYWQRGGQVRTR